MISKNILITGITGQDGLFLTSYLAKESNLYNIIGIARGSKEKFFKNLNTLNQDINSENITILNCDLKDKNQVSSLLQDIKPHKIYNLTGPSSVYESIYKPELYKQLIPLYFNNLVNSCIDLQMYPSFFQASSSEMFSVENNMPLNEISSYGPRNAYSRAKYEVFLSVNNLKREYDWNIKSGIMFNHESEFRPNEFLIMKIIDAAISIKNGSAEKLTLGSLEYSRDWTYASDMADAIIEIINEMEPVDYVIGSGTSHSILDIVKIVFQYFDLEFDDYLEIDNTLLRKGDPIHIQSDPKLIFNRLNWKAKLSLEVMIDKIISSRLN